MGEVHRATDLRKERTVALKRLSVAHSGDEGFATRFRREAEMTARLHEPHVIPIHDYGEIDGQLYLDMRLVEGIDLSGAIAASGPLDPQRAVAVVEQVAAALDAAHRAGARPPRRQALEHPAGAAGAGRGPSSPTSSTSGSRRACATPASPSRAR